MLNPLVDVGIGMMGGDDPPGDTDDGRVRRNRAKHDRPRPDLHVVPNFDRAKNLSANADYDVVADRRVPFAPLLARAPQGYALIERNAIADLGGLADYDAHPMVDKESFADRGSGVDFDARKEA